MPLPTRVPHVVLVSMLAAACGAAPPPLLNNGAEVPAREADETWEGDLSDGATIELDWAQETGITCWTAPENPNFTGSHVFYEREQAEGVDQFIRVTPADGQDLSLYGMRTGTDRSDFPPDMASVPTCETSFDQEYDANPGVAEAIEMTSPSNTYRTVIGVAGAADWTAGGFTVELWNGE
jgi:hypothetical protein